MPNGEQTGGEDGGDKNERERTRMVDVITSAH